MTLSDGDVTSPLSPSGALPIIPSAPSPHHLIVDAPKALPLAPATVSTLVPVPCCIVWLKRFLLQPQV